MEFSLTARPPPCLVMEKNIFTTRDFRRAISEMWQPKPFKTFKVGHQTPPHTINVSLHISGWIRSLWASFNLFLKKYIFQKKSYGKFHIFFYFFFIETFPKGGKKSYVMPEDYWV